MIKMEPGQEFGKWTVISVEDSKKLIVDANAATNVGYIDNL